MSGKFGRQFKLLIEVDGGQIITINNPLSIQFTTNRNVNGLNNTLALDIFNLSKVHRDAIFADPFYSSNIQRHVELQAGYDNLYTIFKGTYNTANSVRRGVNIVTHIDSTSGGYELQNAFVYQTANAGSTHASILQTLMGIMTGLPNSKMTPGVISPTYAQSVQQRPVVLEGNVWSLIKKYSDGHAYIDLEKIYATKYNEYIAGGIPLIDASTGLLDTPKRNNSLIEVATLFEPRFSINQLVQLNSVVNTKYNGQYIIKGIEHSGIISDSVGGQLRTTVQMQNSSFAGAQVKVGG